MPGNIVRHIFLLADIFNVGYIFFQQTLKEKSAYIGLPHDLTKHEVI